MDLEQISDGLREDKILYTGFGLLVITGLVIGLETGIETMEGGQQVEATLNVDFRDSLETNTIEVENNTTVFQALNDTYEVKYTEYDAGAFITSIDGVSQNDKHSWLYFVNDESASVAVDQKYISEGDKITFRYLHNNETSEYVEG